MRIVLLVQIAWSLAVVATLVLPVTALGQTQPPSDTAEDLWVGSWRGTAATPGGATSAVLLTITTDGEVLRGLVSGFGDGTEVPLSVVVADDQRLVAEALAESELGDILVQYELSQGEAGLVGIQRYVLGAQEAEFSVELQRRRRPDVPQPQVEQRLAYFLGAWDLDYTGGEFPPLGQGTRRARVTFTQRGSGPFIRGEVVGDAWGEPYQESLVIGYDESSEALVFQETLWNGVELLSLGNWQSPIAITFVTQPVETEGRRYQLRRLFSMTSDTSFMVTEEFSVDGGPYRRLGHGTYSKTE